MATNVSFVLIKHSFWCEDAALEKFGSNKIISLFLYFRDRNSEITTKDMWNHSFWRPVLGGKIIYAAKPKGRASYAADVSDSEESNSDVKNPTFGAERMDAQHLRQVAGIDHPDAMFIRIQNKSANRTFVKYVPWEQRYRTADCPN